MTVDTATRERSTWTFLSNHAHVMLCLSRDPDMRLRDIAGDVGITERAVSKILDDLEEAGYVTRTREGRRNRYRLHARGRLRHPLERQTTIGELLSLLGDRRD